MKRRIACFSFVVAFLVIGGLAENASADLVLADDNSTMTIDPNSQAGMYSWVVDGTDHLYQQWFWYRVAGMDWEESIDTLDLDFAGVADSIFDPDTDPEQGYLRYISANLFEIEITLVLNGGGPGTRTSDLAESIEIINLTGDTLNMSFFQYCDFDLAGSSDDDAIRIKSGNTAIQEEFGHSVSETANVPSPARGEVNVYDNTLIKLNDAMVSNLSNDFGPLAGPDDFTWAFQWDLSLAPNGSFIISKDKHIDLPEPGAMALLVAGGMVTLIRRRRNR